MTHAVELTNVSKRFGKFTAVDGLTLQVPSGEILGFLGPNGAGKTTTLRMLMSIIYPDSGEISVLGHSNALDVKDRIGYLPEERGLYRKMSVEQTMRYLGRLKSIAEADLKMRIHDSLERIGLGQWRRKSVDSLSKGMQQKIQFATTILHDPDLVVLDEPFSGLDPLNRDLLEDMVLDLRRRGKTVIFSTHQLEQAERLCDRIVLINRGRKLVDGTVSAVRGQFATRLVTVEGAGDLAALEKCPDTVEAQVTASSAQLELRDGGDIQNVLRYVIQHVRVSRFEIASPSLQQIFVKLVGADAGSQRSPDDRAVSGAAPAMPEARRP